MISSLDALKGKFDFNENDFQNVFLIISQALKMLNDPL